VIYEIRTTYYFCEKEAVIKGMIYIDNRQNKISVNEEFESYLIDVINFTLIQEDVNRKVQVSVILVDNIEIRKLNNEFRSIDLITDVLSFPMLEYEDNITFKQCYRNYEFDESFLDGEELVLGDVAISLETAEEQRREYEHSFEREVAYLIVHSILHILGYDHLLKEDKELMREREESILNQLNIKR